MVRWQPGARERLQAAALELFTREGYEQTTVAEIAASAGLTERTFFRHFADKREVLFDGQEVLLGVFLAGIAAAPAGSSPLEAVTAALLAAAEFFPDERRPWSRQRQSVIAANPALQERELLKLAALATAMAGALRLRGVQEPAATLAAESARAVFGVAFAQWIGEGERSFAETVLEALGDLGRITAG